MKRVLFLVGPHASGKSYSSKEYIAKNPETVMIDTGPIMREVHNQDAPELTMGEWVERLEKKYGNDITSQIINSEIKKRMDKSNSSEYILIGFRTLEGIMYTMKNLELKNCSILYVDATKNLLYKNFTLRGGDMTFEKFEKYLENEEKSGLGILKQIALEDSNLIDYYYRTTNDDCIENQIDFQLKKMRKREIEHISLDKDCNIEK